MSHDDTSVVPDPADPVARVARAAARRLPGEGLAADVEAALHGRDGAAGRAPERFLDPVSLGSLVVAVAGLGWTVYTDLRRRTAEPDRDAVVRRVRVQLDRADEAPALEPAERDRIIEVVVEEICASDGAAPDGESAGDDGQHRRSTPQAGPGAHEL
ncbi:hypothetical protein [Streptomyces sp. NPDC051921]|uniref:hypothetical protein n=1 Tax=Streptomyces sp. NPDC051921 TaxID=3155806 RepID=UPI00342A5AA1